MAATQRTRVLSIAMQVRDAMSPALKVARSMLLNVRKVAVGAMGAIAGGVRLVTNAFRAMLGPIGLVLAALGGFGVIKFFSSAARAGDEIFELSQTFGVAAETLSAWKLAADVSDTSIETLARSMGVLAKNMHDASKGIGTAKDSLKALGIDVVDEEGKLRSVDDVILDVADAFSKMDDATRKAAVARELFGRSGAEMIQFLNEGREGLERLGETARRNGEIWTGENARIANEFLDSLRILRGALAGVRNAIGVVFFPMMTEAAQSIADWVAENRERIVVFAISVAKSFRFVAGTIGNVAAMIRELMTDPGNAERLGQVIIAVGDFALNVLTATLTAGLRIISNMLTMVAKPLLIGAAALGRRMGEAILEGIVDPFSTSRVEELQNEINALERRLAIMPIADRSRAGEPMTAQMRAQFDALIAQEERVKADIARLQRELRDEIAGIVDDTALLIGQATQDVIQEIGQDAGDIADAIGDSATAIRGHFVDMEAAIGDVDGEAGERFRERMEELRGSLEQFEAEAMERFKPAAEAVAESMEGISDEADELEVDFTETTSSMAAAARTLDEITDTIRENERAIAAASASMLEGRAAMIATIENAKDFGLEDLALEHAEQLDALQAAYDEGIIDRETFLQGMTASDSAFMVQSRAIWTQYQRDLRELTGSFWTGVELEGRETWDALNDQVAAGRDAFSEVWGAIDSGFDSMFEGIIDGTTTVGDSFEAMGRRILSILAKIAAEQAALFIVRSIFGGVGGFTAAKGAVIDGGRVQKFAKGGLVKRPEFFPLSSGQIGLRGEEGPEFVVPARKGNGELGFEVQGMRGGGGPQNVSIHFTIHAVDAPGVERLLIEQAPTIEGLILRALRSKRDFRETIKAT